MFTHFCPKTIYISGCIEVYVYIFATVTVYIYIDSFAFYYFILLSLSSFLPCPTNSYLTPSENDDDMGLSVCRNLESPTMVAGQAYW